MRSWPPPRLHVFVCANRREQDSPLGTGCAERGDAIYEALKGEVANRKAFARVWVTKTHCLGICPREGATLALYPAGEIVSEVDVTGAIAMMEARDRDVEAT